MSSSGMDIRTPMGLMFGILGVIISAYGFCTIGSPMYDRSLGVNVNLWWGLVLMAFAAVMLGLAWNASNKHKNP
jgi:hypothetical protein